MLEKDADSTRFLNLRNLDLTATNITSILQSLNPEIVGSNPLQSISFSYNPSLGDSGAIALSNHLPKSVTTLGLVSCGITDVGGIELLNWMKNSPRLQMICMEKNAFSEKLVLELRRFQNDHPHASIDY